jgi:hypothetical protein
VPDFSRWGANGGDPSLNAIARTDHYLDALASEQPVYATDPADAELAGLMAGWRDDVRRPPARVASQRDAEIVLQRALAARRRNRMSVAVLGSVAAALLCLGGFTALVAGAGPGDALYGLRTALFGEQQVTRDDQVALAAQTEMQQVQQLIDQGNWTEAQDKLQTVTSTVQTVQDPQRQQQLQDQLNDLTAKVTNRDPNATAPQSQIGPIGPGPAGQLPPGISVPQLPPGIPQLPPGLPQFPDGSLPQFPGPLLPPDISLPSVPVPQLPGPGVPIPLPKPGDQLPNPFPIPKPLPLPDDSVPGPLPIPKPLPPLPGADDSKPKLQDQDQPKPPPALEPPKQLAPAPAPESPPAPVIPYIPPVLAPKAPPALAPPQQDQPPVQDSTTWPPIPPPPNQGGGPKHGN